MNRLDLNDRPGGHHPGRCRMVDYSGTMSEQNDTPHIPIPDNWGEMTEAEQNDFVRAAIERIGQDTGIAPAADDSGDTDDTGDTDVDTAADDTSADGGDTGDTGVATRVFREPGV